VDSTEEQAHLEALREEKRRRLNTIEWQIEAQGGDSRAEPHLLIERGQLRTALGIVEPVIVAKVPVTLGEELGPNGRWLATMEQAVQTTRAIRDLVGKLENLELRFDTFVHSSQEWRRDMRRWLTWIGVVVIILGFALAITLTWLAAKGRL